MTINLIYLAVEPLIRNPCLQVETKINVIVIILSLVLIEFSVIAG